MSEEEIHRKWKEHPMIHPRIQKVTVNISVGKSGNPLRKASQVLEQLTGQQPCKRRAKQTIRGFGIRKGEPIACLVTLRKERAKDFLEKAFQAVDNKLSKESFDQRGNFSFGIEEHIEIPGIRYKPEFGIYGMNISVTVGRPGYRVKRRRRAESKVGSSHLMTAEEAMLFIKDQFDVEIM